MYETFLKLWVFIILHRRKPVTANNSQSELNDDSSVDLAACQVVGHGPLSVGDVSDPVVAVDVADAEKVKTVQS